MELNVVVFILFMAVSALTISVIKLYTELSYIKCDLKLTIDNYYAISKELEKNVPSKF